MALDKENKTTVLLKDIRDEDNHLVADHIWFNYTLGFQLLTLKAGDKICFDARVKPYMKGYSETDLEKPFKFDYKLSHPTKIDYVFDE